MLSIQAKPNRLCDSWSRRDFLQIGSLGCLGLALPELLQSQAHAAQSSGSFGRAKRCILLFLTGGPPQHDTWDPKPHAPIEIRGEFRPIATSVPGIQISEMFPLLARQAHKYCILRSVTHRDTTHTSAGYTMLTGAYHDNPNVADAAMVRPSAKDRPHLGSILTRTRRTTHGLPSFVSLPEIIKDAAVNEFPGQGAGFLGQRYAPLLVDGGADGNLRPPEIGLSRGMTADRLTDRRGLLEQLDRSFARAQQNRHFEDLDAFHAQAIDMLRSPAAQKAFVLDDEPVAKRERYGEHLFGKGCLLARRLVEAGVQLVSVYWHYEGPEDSPVWDTHGNNFQHLRERLMPPADLAISALLLDLDERGMLDDTLVICMGEFGRSPKINNVAGRDHWPNVQSMMLAGAGIHSGTVYGSSDRIGGEPAENAVTPPDLFATFMHLLGLDPAMMLTDLDGRPIQATSGEPITALFG